MLEPFTSKQPWENQLKSSVDSYLNLNHILNPTYIIIC